MHDDQLLRFADDLLQARDEGRTTARPSEHDASFDLDAGYQVGRIAHEQMVERGYRVAGRKIGFTNPAMWQAFGVAAPLWAHVYHQTVFFAEQGVCRLPLGRKIAPRLEPEIVLKLRSAVPADATTAEAVLACVEWAALGFEIVDCHYPDWKFTAGDAVASFGMHAALVVGTPLVLPHDDPAVMTAQLAEVEVTLSRGDELVASGFGRNALGGSLLSVAHLVRVLATQPWAAPLAAGDVVTTGTLTNPAPVQRGEVWTATAQGMPLEKLTFELVS